MHTKQWHVDVFLSEDGDVTRARAVLTADVAQPVTAVGLARRNPRDPQVPEIGDELAVARALGALSRELADIAYVDVDASAGDDFRAD